MNQRESRVLIGAYACGPGPEPEAAAAWEIARAATNLGRVWVVTRPRFRRAIDAALEAEPELRKRLAVEYLDLPPRIQRYKRGALGVYWYYLLWQRALGARAIRLHHEHDFTALHHATFANDWMPSGLTAVPDVPLVWGPVGGSSRVPLLRLGRWLGVRGCVTEIVREAVTSLARRSWGVPVARRARLMIAQNDDVRAAFEGIARDIVVEPNAALTALPHRRAELIRDRHAVFAGRLVAWKGAALAVDAVAHPAAAGWTLTIFGSGYARRSLERRAARRGVADRVTFAGHRPRAEVLQAMSTATVFLFPSMHDQAGWVVAEASTMGCPVVCLPLGGPPVLAEPNGYVVPLRGDIAARTAACLVAAADGGGIPSERWSSARLPALVAQWYAQAATSDPIPGPRPVAVLESFGDPKSTTNPYITQLHTALQAHDDVRVSTFTFRRALLGRYDVVHLHWPELMVDGHSPLSRTLRRTLTVAAAVRWRLTRTPVVRTRHNLERPSGLARVDTMILDLLDSATTTDIALNTSTPPRGTREITVIPHGHYRDWYIERASEDAVPGRVAYVGLLRRYKGVESLVSAFVEWDAPEMTLRITGRPSQASLVDEMLQAAAGDPRIEIDPRFLDDADFTAAVRSAELIVLPYRHMHNSGTVIAALSLGRPVLVPDNTVNRALRDEVGSGWVHLFSGTLDAADLQRAWSDSRAPEREPDLSTRDWERAAEEHAAVFRSALATPD